MSAVISGSGLGLFQSNLTSGIGAFGNAALGQAKEQVYVNAATGSLVVQNSDEALTGLGLGFSMLRTYNSAAGFDGDNDDQWRLGYLSTISLVGEEYKRVTADGFVQTFRKDALGNYVSFEGAASADRLTIVSANEVYVTSEGGIRETYRDGKLTDRTTPVGGYSVVYNNGKPERIIQRLTTGLTDETLIQYYGSTDAAAGLIKSIQTSSATGLQNRVEYRYDTAKRLQYVLIDKTPQLASDNNATFTSDSNRFVIQYGYADATSKRLTSIKQFQGNNTNSTSDNKVELAVTYYADTEAEHIRGRVQTLTQGLYSTTFTYIDANKTRVTQGSQTVDYEFDANERLVNVSYDLKGGASASAYTYNGNGQLETMTDSLGQVTRYTYDISGNLVSITAPGLAANNRTYNSQNQLQTEQIGTAVKRYVYDSTGQFLRFALGADGSVSEFRYNALNQQIQQRVYHGKTVSLTGLTATQVPTLATMESWVSTLADKTAQQLTEFEYDIRGNLSKRRQFSAIDSTGNGVGDASTWLYVYDFRGQLLQETKPLGSGTAAAFDETVTYAYDGLGRVLTRVDAQNNSTNFVFNDGNRTMEVRYDNGKVERSTYDKSGQITTVRTEDAFNGSASFGDVTYLYDDAGRQVAERDQHGQWVYRFFEENGALAADVGKGGEVRRYYYDKAGRLIKTVEFSGWGMSRSGWIVSNKLNYTLAALDVVLDGRLTSDPARRESMVIYKDNRKQFDIDAAGYVTEYRYNADGLMQNMRRYATAATAAEIGAQLVGFNTNGALASQITYTYDISGRVKTETNGEGYRTEYHYDVAGRKIASTQYVKKVVNDTVTATPGEDRVEHWRYDAQGRIVASVTADGVVRRFQYDINGQLLQQDQYATTVRNLAIGAQLTLPSGAVRSTTYTYDGNGRVLTETSPDGITQAYRYDAVGNVIEKWQGTAQIAANRVAAQSRAVLSESFINGESSKLVKSVSAGSTDQVYAESGRMVLSRQTVAAGVSARGYYSSLRLSNDLAASLAQPIEYEFDLSFSQASGNYLPVYLSSGNWGQADATRFGVYANGSTLQFYKHFAGATNTQNVLSIAANATYRVKFITSREGVEVVVSELVNSQYIERGRTVHTVPALVRDKDYTLTFESNAQTTGYTQKAYVDNVAVRTFDAANPVDTTKAYTQERYQYDVNSRQIAALDANSNKALGLSASAAAVKAAFATTATTRNIYDLAGNLIESRDAEGNRSLFYYDSANRMTVSIDADRNLTRYVYNAFDELTQQLNAVKPVPEDQYARLLTDRASFADAGYELSNREIGKVLTTYLSSNSTLAINKDPADVWQVITRNKVGQGVDLYRDLTLYGVNATAGRVFQTYTALGVNATQTMQQAYTVYDATSKTYKAQTGNLVLKQTQDLRGLTDTSLRNGVVQTDNDYDAFGRLIKTTATENRVNEVSYTLDVPNDKVGRVVTSWQTVAGAQRKTISRYDAFDRLLETLDANGVVTTYSYDDQKRQYSVTVDGITTRTSRNEIGRVVLIEVLSGVTVLQSTKFDYDANGNQTDVWLNNVRQEGRSYTKNNQLEFLTNANGQKIQTRYSKTGKKVATIVDAEGLKLETSWKFGANTTVVQQTNGERLSWVTYDKNGRVRYQDELEFLADGSRFKNRTSYKYDQAGNQLEVVTGVRIKIDAANNEVKDAQGQVIVDTTAQLVSRFEYDILNRLIRQYQLAGTSPTSEVQFAYDQADRLIERVEVLSASQKIRTFYGYNEASELVYEAKSHSVNAASLQLSVQSYEYDKRGLKIAIHQYSQLLNTGVAETAALTPAVLAPKVLALTGKISSYIAYDVQGRQIATVNAVGQRNFTRYDGLGRVVETFTLATNSLLSNSELNNLRNGTFTIPSAGTTDSRIAYLYNELNQQVLKLVSTGTQALISAMTYDSQGQLVQARQYATTLAYRNNYGLSEIRAALVTNASDRVRTYLYDSVGQQRFVIDSAGVVQETRYNRFGETERTIVHNELITSQGSFATAWRSGSLTYSLLQTKYPESLNLAGTRTLAYEYNSLGQLVKTTYPETNAQGQAYTEQYVYNAAGLKTLFTDKNGRVWAYEYDAAGRVSAEFTPELAAADGIQTLTANGYSVQVGFGKKSYQYDGMGNITTIREGIVSSADKTTFVGQVRETRFEYDKAGRQFKVIQPDVGSSAPNAFTETYYDAFGRAALSLQYSSGVVTHASYKVYTVASQLKYEIEASEFIQGQPSKGFITAYQYNGLGDQTILTRYATAIDIPKSNVNGAPTSLTILSEAQVAGAVRTNADDREVTTLFDVAGRKTSVQEKARSYLYTDAQGQVKSGVSGQPTVVYEYNSFGEVWREKVAVGDGTNLETLSWYDLMGRKTWQVDAGGYVTQWLYYDTGEVRETIEYARALDTNTRAQLSQNVPPLAPAKGDATTGLDRRVGFEYDKLGRQTKETRYQISAWRGNAQTLADESTSKSYDGTDRVTAVNTAVGTTNYQYDALGNLQKTTGPSAVVTDFAANQALAQLQRTDNRVSEFVYDIFGNVIEQRQRANSRVQDNNRDTVTRFEYNSRGQAVSQTTLNSVKTSTGWQALNQVQTMKYDARGNIVNSKLTYQEPNLASALVVKKQGTYETTVWRRGEPIDQIRTATLGDWLNVDLVTGEIFGTGGTNQSYLTLTIGVIDGNGEYKEYSLTDVNFTVGTPFRIRVPQMPLMGAAERNDIVVETTYEYTLQGDVKAQTQSRTGLSNTASDQTVFRDETKYNAFGEVIQKLTTATNADSALQASMGVQSQLYQYNSSGQVIKTNERDNVLLTSDYDLAGRLVRTTHQLNGETLFKVNALGRVEQISAQGLESAARFNTYQSFDRWGNVISVTDARGYLYRYEYNQQNQVTVEYRPKVAVVSERGEVSQVVTSSTKRYDAQGSLVLEVDANGNQRKYQVNVYGEQISSTDGEGKTTYYGYDAFGRMVTTQDPSGLISYSLYNQLGLVTETGVTYKEQGAIQNSYKTVIQNLYEYNGAGQRISSTDAEGNIFAYRYDARGSVVLSLSPARTRKVYGYNAQGQKVLEAFANQRNTSGAPSIRQNFGSGGQLLSKSDLSGKVTSNTYTKATGLVVNNGVTSEQTLQDSARVERVVDQYGRDLSYYYYANGWLKSVVDNTNNATSSYGYNANGQRTWEVHKTFDGKKNLVVQRIESSFDEQGRVSKVLVWDSENSALESAKLLTRIAYQYDAVGNRRSISMANSYEGTISPNAGLALNTTSVLLEEGFTVNEKAQKLSAVTDNIGTTLQFSAEAGWPTWLGIAADGSLTGTTQLPLDLPLSITVQVTVREFQGATLLRTITKPLTINIAQKNQAPIGSPIVAISVSEDQFVQVDLSKNFRDPDGDKLLFSAVGLPTSLSLDANTGMLIGTTAFTDAAVYSVQVTAADPKGLKAVQPLTLTILNKNRPPQGSIPNISTVETELLSYDIKQFFRDPDAEAVTYSAVTIQQVYDNATRTMREVEAALPIGLSMVNGVLTGTPNDTSAGSYLIEVRGNDGQVVGKTRFNLTITNKNLPPRLIAPIPEQNSTEGTYFEFNLASNFIEPDGELISYEITGLPGWLTLNAAGKLVGTPPYNANGSHIIGVTAMDASGNRAAPTSFKLNVANVNGRPYGTVLPLTISEGQVVSYNTAGYFTDPDGDRLTFSAVFYTREYDSELRKWLEWQTTIPEGLTFDNNGLLAGKPTYTTAGEYAVVVTANDGSLTGSSRFILTIGNSSAPPQLVTPIPEQNVTEGVFANLALAGYFVEPDGEAMTFTASGLPEGLTLSSAGQLTGSASYTAAGPYTVTITARDATNNITSTTFSLVVTNNNAAPTGTVPAQTANEGQAFNVNFANYFTDVDADPLTFNLRVLVREYDSEFKRWDEFEVGLPEGMNYSAGVLSGTPSFTTAGSYILEVTANDGRLTGTSRATLTINNQSAPPVVVTPIPTHNSTEGSAVNLNIAGHFSDPDGEVLTFSATGMPSGFSMSNAGVMSGVLWYNQHGNYTITVRATDPTGKYVTSTFNFVVADANGGPSGSVPALTINEGQTVNYNTAAYFSDPDGDALTYTARFLVREYDAELKRWMEWNVGIPEGLSFGINGVLSGVPSFTTAGTYVVEVKANDGSITGISRFDLTIANTSAAPKLVTPIPEQNVTEGVYANLALASHFVEPDGEAMTFTASGLPAGLSLTSAGQLIGIAGYTAAGRYTVTMVARDATNNTTSTTFSLVVANNNAAPTGTVPTQTANEGQAFSLNFSNYFSDVDGDTLTYSLRVLVREYDAEFNRWDEYEVGVPEGMNFSAGILSGTPSFSAAGSYILEVTASDGRLTGSSRSTLNINNQSAPPVIVSPIPTQNVTEGSAVNINVAGYFSDPDADALTFSATGLPSGLSMSTAGLITGWLGYNQNGNYPVTVRATDPSGKFVTSTFTLAVANANGAPSGSVPVLNISEGQSVNYNTAAYFSDPDGDALTYSARFLVREYDAELKRWMEWNVGIPEGLSFGSNGVLSGVPSFVTAGSYVVEVTANDGRLSGTSRFTLNIGNVSAPPRLVSPIPTQNATEGSYSNLSFAGYFIEPDSEAMTFTASGLPAGMSLSSAGQLTGTPGYSAAGTYTVTLVARDASGNTTSTTFTLIVANSNAAPTGSVPAQVANEGQAFAVNLASYFSDVDGDPLSFSLRVLLREFDAEFNRWDEFEVGLPQGLNFSAGVLSGTPSYTTSGSYILEVTASDGRLSGTSRATLTINNQSAPPVIVSPIPTQNVTEGSAVNINVAGYFSDPDADALTFSATGLPSGLTISTAGLITGWLGYNQNGNYPVTVRATDPSGKFVSTTFTLAVSNVNGGPSGSVPALNISEGQSVNYNTAAYFSDPDGDALTYSARFLVREYDAELKRWMEWNVGIPEGLSFGSNGVLSGVPSFVTAGSYVVEVTANDGRLSGTSRFTLNIGNVSAPPRLVSPIPLQNAAEGSYSNLSFAGYFIEPDSEAMTFTASGLPAGMSLSSAGQLTGTPGYSAAGTYTVTLTARDASGNTTSTTFTLIVANANAAPTGSVPAQVANEGQAFNVNFANYFSDVDGDALSFSLRVLQRMYDSEMRQWEEWDVSIPEGLSFNGRVLSGTPSYNTSGSYILEVTASDGRLSASARATFTINDMAPPNRAPITSGLANQTVSEGVAINIATAPAFSDPDGSALTFSASGLPAGLSINTTTGQITGTLGYSQQGSYGIQVTARDPSGLTVSATFTLTVTDTNRAPEGSIPGTAMNEGQYASLNIASSFYDPDGDSVSYSAIFKIREYDSELKRWYEFPTSIPTGLSFASNGILSGTPSYDAAGSYKVEVTASDGRLSAMRSFTLTINDQAAPNRAPTASALASQTVDQGQQVNIGTAGAFSDPDGDVLVFSSPNLPAGLALNASTGLITGSVGTPGSYTITVIAADNRGGSVSSSFTLQVNVSAVNRPPVLNKTPFVPASLNQYDTFYVDWPADTFIDPDGGPITYTATAMPAGLYFYGSSIEGEVMRVGTFTITIEAKDAQGATASFSKSFTVRRGSTIPRRVEIPMSVASQSDSAISLDLTIENEIAALAPVNTNAVSFKALTPEVMIYPMIALEPEFPGEPELPEDPTPVEAQIKSYWYTYDGNNRVLIDGGSLINGQVSIKDQGMQNFYNDAGLQAFRLTSTNGRIDATRYSYNQFNQLEGLWALADNTTDLLTQPGQLYSDTADWRRVTSYQYDSLGRIKQVESHFTSQESVLVGYDNDGDIPFSQPDRFSAASAMMAVPGNRTPVYVTVDLRGASRGLQVFSYNADGQQTMIQDLALSSVNYEQAVVDKLGLSIDDRNRTVRAETVFTSADVTRNVSVTGFSNFNEAGLAQDTSYSNYITDGTRIDKTNSYKRVYDKRDTWLEVENKGTGTVQTGSIKPANTFSRYDQNGNRILVEEQNTLNTSDIQGRRMTYAADGTLLKMESGTQTTLSTQTFSTVNGKTTLTTTYAAFTTKGEALHFSSNGNYLGEIAKDKDGKITATLKDQHFDGSGADDSSSVMRHQVRSGETLRSIAMNYYGSSEYWYLLANRNGVTASPDEALTEGMSLDVPSRARTSNTATSYKPMELDRIIGDTTPSLPYVPPAPKKGCNALAMVVMIAITVIATVATAGAAALAMGGVAGSTGLGVMATGTAMLGGASIAAGGAIVGAIGATAAGMAAAAVGGFVGSVAGQLAGKAMGVVDHFSLKNAFVSGLTAGATAGLGSALKGAEWATMGSKQAGSLNMLGKMASAAAGVGVNWAANALVGNNASFRWRDVVSRAVTAGAMDAFSVTDIGSSMGRFAAEQSILGGTLQGIAGAAIGYGVRKALYNEGSWNFRDVAVDSFGNSLANTAVAKLTRYEEYRNDVAELTKIGATPEEIEYLASGKEAAYNVFKNKAGISREKLLEFHRHKDEILAGREFELADFNALKAGETFGIAGYKGGSIKLSKQLMDASKADGSFGEQIRAVIKNAIDEETGHFIDDWLRGGSRNSDGTWTSGSGDSVGDEGAEYAFEVAKLTLASGASGYLTMDLSAFGGSRSVSVNRDMYGIVSAGAFDPVRIARDLKAEDGTELYGKEGHYYATALITKAITNDPDKAVRIAFWSQIPDLMPEMDAINRAVSLGLNLSSAAIQKVASLQNAFHALGVSNMDSAREDTRKIIIDGLNSGTPEGEVQAGLGIHRLADTFAHTSIFSGIPFLPIIGHLFEGKLPDDPATRLETSSKFANYLAETIATGYSKPTDGKSIKSYTSQWLGAVENATVNLKFSGDSDLLTDLKGRYKLAGMPEFSSEDTGALGNRVNTPRFSAYSNLYDSLYKGFGGDIPDKMNFNVFARGYDAYMRYFK